MTETKEQLIERIKSESMWRNWSAIYDAIAAHAIREDRLKLLGARPIDCGLCSDYTGRVHNVGCRITKRCAKSRDALHAACPRPEA